MRLALTPTPGLEVVARLASGRTWPMVGGKTTIEDLPAGTWILDATAGDGRRWSTTVVATGAASVPVILE